MTKYTTLITIDPQHEHQIEGVGVNRQCSAFNGPSRTEWIRQQQGSLTDTELNLCLLLLDRSVPSHYFQISCVKAEAWEKATGGRYSDLIIKKTLNRLQKKGLLEVQHDQVIVGRRVTNRHHVRFTPSLEWLQARDRVLHGRDVGRKKDERQPQPSKHERQPYKAPATDNSTLVRLDAQAEHLAASKPKQKLSLSEQTQKEIKRVRREGLSPAVLAMTQQGANNG